MRDLLRTFLLTAVEGTGHSFNFPGSEEPDYVKHWIASGFGVVQGRPGDVLVVICLIGAATALLRKKYKTAVGFVLLTCGLVVIRVAISIMFGGADFSSTGS